MVQNGQKNKHFDESSVQGSADGQKYACLCSKEGQDACAAPDVQHCFALDQMTDALDCILVTSRSHCILQHLLMDACIDTGAEG